MENKIVKNSILINASPDKVWEALVNPELTKKYMFGCETVSDWKVGSELLWRGNYEGKEMVFVKEFVLEIGPNKKIEYTVIDPNATYPHTPENHLNVMYDLSFSDNHTTLTISQDGFETAADGEKRYTDVYNNGDGWNPILKLIKAVVESE